MQPSKDLEAFYKGFIPYREMSPEEYVGRKGHTVALGGPFELHWPDPEFRSFMRAVGELLADGRLQELQERYLAPEELEAVRNRDKL